MCGIAGIIRFDGQTADAGLVAAMLGRLSHRGQDHCEVRIGSAHAIPETVLSRQAEVALGHRRLSIIDLSDEASQPMSYAEGRLWIVFNGEIYNYVELRQELSALGYAFHTKSDTEVILAAYKQWGDACVQRLNGMFAFALWDDIAQKLFCARDHLGIKPFYVYRTGEFLAFASESQALQKLHRNRLNPDGLASYLLGLYVPAHWSIFAGVTKLLPAHTLAVHASGEVLQKRYWQVSQIADIDDTVPARKQMEDLLVQAVKRQLRSDVPVGALLSGGVDSGMIVALAARQVQDLHTYSVGFEGHPVNELPAAAAVAKKFHTRHREVMLADKESIKYLDIALRHLSEPIADPSIVPSYILPSLAAQDGVKVLLSGTGGDEIFGGYDRYVGGATWQRRILSGLPEGARALIGRVLPPSSKLGARLSNPYLDMLFTTAGSFDLCSSMLRDKNAMLAFLQRLTEAFPASPGHNRSLLYKQMGFDLSVYLPDEILFLFDQMSMASTIEGRVPLLDVDVVEMAFRFPSRSHVNGGRTKVLFREIAESYLGHEHVWRKKHGFSGPVPWWVNQNLQLFVSAAKSVVDIPGLEKFDVGKHLRPNGNGEMGAKESHALFILYCLRRWYDHQLESA
jgi:asparagine synthase (glutamine-hydrolysing)